MTNNLTTTEMISSMETSNNTKLNLTTMVAITRNSTITKESADTLSCNVTLSSTLIQQSTDNSSGNKYYILMKVLEFFVNFCSNVKPPKHATFSINREHKTYWNYNEWFRND